MKLGSYVCEICGVHHAKGSHTKCVAARRKLGAKISDAVKYRSSDEQIRAKYKAGELRSWMKT